jgi:hypothetical protein
MKPAIDPCEAIGTQDAADRLPARHLDVHWQKRL